MPAPTPAPAWEWPDALAVAAHNPESVWYSLTAAWAPLLEKDTGMLVRVKPEMPDELRLKLIKAGTYDVATVALSPGLMVLEGNETTATRDLGPYPFNVVWLCNVQAFGVMVRGDSDIQTMQELRNPDVTWACPPGAGPIFGIRAAAAWAGITPEELEPRLVKFGAFDAAIRAVPEGKVDCGNYMPATGEVFEAEGTPHGIRWLEMDPRKDPEAFQRYLALRPVAVFGPATAGVVPSAQGVWMNLSPSYYCCSEDADPELTYRLAKWFDESFDAYKGLHQSAPDMSIENFRAVLDTNIFPVHEGVIRYLKEKGMWTAADDERQAYYVSQIKQWEDAFKAAIAEADEKGIKVDPLNEAWMSLWGEHKKDLPRYRTMIEIP